MMENDQTDWIAGIDEAGRGPLIGPVVAAAVILDPRRPIVGLKDSKALTAKQRDYFYELIQAEALAWAVASASPQEIDQINILQATLLAMQRAVANLTRQPTLALIDGNKAPLLACPTKTIIQGDQRVPVISAASILAKVTRDQTMQHLDQLYPHYGLAKHKGYPTREHLRALNEHGPTPLHRYSFAPVREALARIKNREPHLEESL